MSGHLKGIVPDQLADAVPVLPGRLPAGVRSGMVVLAPVRDGLPPVVVFALVAMPVWDGLPPVVVFAPVRDGLPPVVVFALVAMPVWDGLPPVVVLAPGPVFVPVPVLASSQFVLAPVPGSQPHHHRKRPVPPYGPVPRVVLSQIPQRKTETLQFHRKVQARKASIGKATFLPRRYCPLPPSARGVKKRLTNHRGFH